MVESEEVKRKENFILCYVLYGSKFAIKRNDLCKTLIGIFLIWHRSLSGGLLNGLETKQRKNKLH